QLDGLVETTAYRGVELGAIREGRRERSDGVVLTWKATDPNVMLADGLVPFFIDWGASPHPASGAAAGLTLVALRGEHPHAGYVPQLLERGGIEMRVDPADAAALVATLRTADGVVELR